MKRIAALLLALMLLCATGALADPQSPMTLFTTSFATTQATGGVYVQMHVAQEVLYSGPGYDYVNIGEFDLAGRQVHCYTLATDRSGEMWVLLDFTDPYVNWRGYVPLRDFAAPDRAYLMDALPHEAGYDDLTPYMIAQLYLDCSGLWGPGEGYYELTQLPAATVEGTLILQQGDWGLLELNAATVQRLGLYAGARVWVELSNCMY